MRVSYRNYYDRDYEGGEEMRGSADIYLERIRFESYAEFRKWLEDEGLYPGVNTRYDGTQTCGDVEIKFSANKMTERDRVLKKAGEILRFL